LMVVSVIVMVGTFFRMSISSYYTNEFSQKINSAAATELVGRIETLAAQNAGVSQISPVIETYSSRLGVDMFRTLYLLDGTSAQTLFNTNTAGIASLEKTPNIIAALNGKEGNTVLGEQSYLDWAAPIVSGGGVKYVLYVKDTKQELNEIVGSMLTITLQAMLFGLLISFILGYFMSKTITSPIISLTDKAESLSAGDFETKITVRSDDEIGQLSHTFNIMADRLKNNLSTIEEEKNKFETILMFMTDGVMAFDSRGKLIHMNRAAEKILSITEPSDFIEFDDYFNKVDADISLSEIRFKINETLQRDITVNGRNIQVFFASIARSEAAGVAAVIVVLRDITEQHLMEQSRREFVSNVSHELRTPITTVKTYSETIMESEDLPPEMMKNFLNVISSEADRMARLVTDLLTLSRLDYDKSDMPKEPFDLTALLTDITNKLSFEAENKNHAMSLSFAGKIKPFYGNKDRIEQVITNIITNAIKYTPEGGTIKVSAGCVYDKIYIKVKDNGIGIPKDDVPHIFDRFYRVDKARSRQSGGTGLGLAIAQELVAAHDGTISIQSGERKGTEVIMQFPCKEDVTLS
ncbi:MAG: HAMP domain-containing protein, partial [Oscillospiraceae bacterium]|nr:HAMP domain-containing protein [Oscillospiraceae bacterium]